MNPDVGGLPWKAWDGSGNVTSDPAGWRLSRHSGCAGTLPSPQKGSMISAVKTPALHHPTEAAALQQQSWISIWVVLETFKIHQLFLLGGRASRKSILFWLQVLQRVSSDHQHCSAVLCCKLCFPQEWNSLGSACTSTWICQGSKGPQG